MKLTSLIPSKIKSIIYNFLPLRKRKVFKISSNQKWAYVSYLIEPLFRKNDDVRYFNRHQNRREALVIKDVLLENGYNVVFEQFDSKMIRWNFLYKNKFDLVFGLEPDFGYVAKHNPTAKKIYYATGAYYEHQNKMIRLRTESFNLKYNANYSISRTIEPHNSINIADRILQIGSVFTINTYPVEYRGKITLIDQSNNITSFFQKERKIKSLNKNEYIWFGGGGNILKGLDIAIEYFSKHPEYKLHIIGNVEEVIIKNMNVNSFENILLHGYMDIDSPEFSDIVYRCAFCIYPSASEGCPGTVIQLMCFGVIPIVSKWAAFDEIENYGFIIDLDIDSIHQGITWSQNLSVSQLHEKSIDCAMFAASKWNLKSFKQQFATLITTL